MFNLTPKCAMVPLSLISAEIVGRWGFTFTYYQGQDAEICEIWDPTLNRYCGGGYLTGNLCRAVDNVYELKNTYLQFLRSWLADAILERYTLTHKDTE